MNQKYNLPELLSAIQNRLDSQRRDLIRQRDLIESHKENVSLFSQGIRRLERGYMFSVFGYLLLLLVIVIFIVSCLFWL